MKVFWTLIFAIALFSCKQKNDTPKLEANMAEFITHTYKLDGLNDSIISDSVWKIMFVYPEIEQLAMDNKDSMLVLTVSSTFNDIAKIENEIEKRGARILEKIE